MTEKILQMQAELPFTVDFIQDNSEKDGYHIKNEEAVIRAFREKRPLSAARFYLRTEAFALSCAYTNNKILSLSNSRTRILAHQVDSTYRIINALRPRFLLADEVGLGKTIEAGLVIKELIYRYKYRRILIICPASLLLQWQNELHSRFNEDFTIMDRKALNKAGTGQKNRWKAFDRIICSIDFIKSPAFSEELTNMSWDAVIFDEAHRLRRDEKHATRAYTIAEIISRRTKALLLLSATPFRGKLEELYYLLGLIDENILGPFQSFYSEYCSDNADLQGLKQKISPIIIRRTKKEVGGFTRRFARTIKFDLYPDERKLYDETSRYVAEEFNRAMKTENRAVGFVMTVFQKLLDSSSHALGSALKKRLTRLKDMADNAGKVMPPDLIEKKMDILYPEDIIDRERLDQVVALDSGKNVEEIRLEIQTLKRLVRLADSIKHDKKGKRLYSLIKNLFKKGHKKVLIFTQFRTTQVYLQNILSEWGPVIFNGSMNRNDKERAITLFKEKAAIMIATEAGGEGRNMQFCNILINYDLPWSPLRIEQRIGRIHRFGQKDDVFIYNFSTLDTVAERVLEILEKKLKLFEGTLGTPDVLLGGVEDELQLNRLIMEMASGSRTSQSLNHELEKQITAAQKSYKKLGELTLAGKMDLNYDEYYRITMQERKFSNSRIERFVNLLLEEDKYHSNSLQKNGAGRYNVKTETSDGTIYKEGTFDSSVALNNEKLEFLAFGHPVVDKLVNYCCADGFGGLCGVRFIKHEKNFHGMLFNYSVTYSSVDETSEIIPVAIINNETLNESLLNEIEQDCIDQVIHLRHCENYFNIIDEVTENLEDYIHIARDRIMKKSDERVTEMSDMLDLKIYPEIEKVTKSYNSTIKELKEKLEIQEAKIKWYEGDLRGAITRTKNQIQKKEREREMLLKQYRDYLGITRSITLINMAVLISIPVV